MEILRYQWQQVHYGTRMVLVTADLILVYLSQAHTGLTSSFLSVITSNNKLNLASKHRAQREVTWSSLNNSFLAFLSDNAVFLSVSIYKV